MLIFIMFQIWKSVKAYRSIRGCEAYTFLMCSFTQNDSFSSRRWMPFRYLCTLHASFKRDRGTEGTYSYQYPNPSHRNCEDLKKKSGQRRSNWAKHRGGWSPPLRCRKHWYRSLFMWARGRILSQFSQISIFMCTGRQ